MKKILIVGSEAMPFAATGGLGDVLGSLPIAIKERYGEEGDVRVVLPLYDTISEALRKEMKDEAVFTLNLAWRTQYCGIKSIVRDGVIYYFVDNEYYFRRGSLYGHYDDGERYAYFCLAVIEMMSHINFYPDVLHANDWQSALSVIYLKTKYYNRDNYRDIKTVFTIHNIEYQGKYDFFILGDVFGLEDEYRPLLAYDGCINLMKGAIETADIVSTVSPKYAEEIKTQEYSCGLHYVLNDNSHKLCGILNGIDYKYYAPRLDKDIEVNFSDRTVKKKALNKLALQKELGLPIREDVPMLAIISRLASHKGLDLISDIAYNLLYTHDIQLVLLGTGESKYENFFFGLENNFRDKVRSIIKYDRALSKRIYASADIFLMPSKSEPCGLSQMIASRYGAVPITRETGGLYDSIKGYYEQNGKLIGNGFTFSNYSSSELYDRINAALNLYDDKEKHYKFIKQIMKVDFSWKKSADRYIKMYDKL